MTLIIDMPQFINYNACATCALILAALGVVPFGDFGRLGRGLLALTGTGCGLVPRAPALGLGVLGGATGPSSLLPW